MPVTVGLDTSYYNTSLSVDLGFAVGQTFYAAQTEIAAITVWRIPDEANFTTPSRIFIMGLDSTGVPDVYNILQDGPALPWPQGDGVHATPLRFDFDPPVVLPGVGEYEFAVQGDSCRGVVDLVGNGYGGQNYLDGEFWYHGREATLCYYKPRVAPESHPDTDVVFEIEFCPTNTLSRPVTWGAIKALYK